MTDYSIPQRWDNGLWDSATWDGQLGINAATTPVVITVYDASFNITKLLTADTTSVVITPQQVTFSIARRLVADTTAVVISTPGITLPIGYRFPVDTTPVVITPQDVQLIGPVVPIHIVLLAETVSVLIEPQFSSFSIGHALNPFPQPGAIHMGIPKYFVDRW